jgi:hypothetical protein
VNNVHIEDVIFLPDFLFFVLQELTSGVKGLAMDDDMEKSEVDRINILHDFIKAKLNQTPGSLALTDEKAIFAEAERLEISSKVNTGKSYVLKILKHF